jgi:hypothetical protein
LILVPIRPRCLVQRFARRRPFSSGPCPRSAAATPSDPEEDKPGRESVDQVVVVFAVVAAMAPPFRPEAGGRATWKRTVLIDNERLSNASV